MTAMLRSIDTEQIRSLVAAGMSDSEIAREIGATRMQVAHQRYRLGLEATNPRGWSVRRQRAWEILKAEQPEIAARLFCSPLIAVRLSPPVRVPTWDQALHGQVFEDTAEDDSDGRVIRGGPIERGTSCALGW